MSEYALLFVIILGVNLMPALGPPTWTILVLFSLNTSMPTAAVVVIGAIAAATGRFFLATVFRLIGARLSVHAQTNLRGARELLKRSKSKTIAALAVFVLSPLPSAQLFEAAGLMRVRLLPFTAAFFGGRLVSYFIYASTAAEVRESSVGEAFKDALTQPIGIAIQLVVIGFLVALTRVNWTRLLTDDA
jgi:uncharacterized membrane protein YdjX (TVP38/TMEM64 family)